jgi:photosystem II stability/assembly factor-like uncharacterized protein
MLPSRCQIMAKQTSRIGFILLFFALISPGSRVQSSTVQPQKYINYFPIIAIPAYTYLPLVMMPDPLPVWLGPDGGTVVALVIDPQQSNIMYAGSWGAGVFKSTDGGSSWQPANSGLGNLYINSLAIDPTHSSVVYAGTYRDEVYKTTDAGQTWFQASRGIVNGAIVYAIAVDPTNSQRLYIGTRGPDSNSTAPWYGVVYRSTDGGASWVGALTNIGGTAQQDWVYSISVLPQKTSEILVASHEHGPFLSTDYGVTWQAVISGIDDLSGRAVVFDPRYASPATAYFGVWHHSGVFKTTNDGKSWTVKASGVNSARIFNLAVDPASPSTLYAATFGSGVLKTTNGGNAWASVGLQSSDLYVIAVNPQNHTTLFASTSGNGLFKSTNSGGSWFASQHGLTNTDSTAVISRPDDANTLLMSTFGSGILISRDGGVNWSPINNNLSDVFVHTLVENPANPNLFYALTDTGGLFRLDASADANWSKVTDDVPAPANTQPAYGFDHPFANHAPAIDDLPDSYGPRAMETLPSSVPLLAMVFAPSNPQTVYLGTSGAGIYKSTDGGAHWNASGLAGFTVWGLAVDPDDPNRLYAATNVNGVVKTSLDGGANWKDSSLPSGLTVYTVVASAAEPATIYAGTSSGVYRLVNGSSWTVIGLEGQQVTALATHPTNNRRLIAGTTSGAAYTDDDGATWFTVETALSGLTIQSISFSLADPLYVYFSTKTSGALKIFIR